MMSKKSMLTIFVVIIVIIILVMIFPVYRNYASGDIDGPPVLQYQWLNINFLCSLMGGELYEEPMGWSNKYNKNCVVKNKIICNIRNGEIKKPDAAYGYSPDGACVRQ